jgi:hypothetical protein
MKRTITTIGLIFLLGFGLMVFDSYGEEPALKGLHSPFEVGQILGSSVMNAQKEYLGSINDFIIDNERITFAILSHGGFWGIGRKLVAIPFGALSYEKMDRHFVLDISREKLESAPRFDRNTDLGNRQWAEDVYRYFGLQPYW